MKNKKTNKNLYKENEITYDEMEYVRETFLSFEYKLIKQVSNNSKYRKLINELMELDDGVLYKMAYKLLCNIEYGMVPEDKLELTEKYLVILFLSIKGIKLQKYKILIKNEELIKESKTEENTYCKTSKPYPMRYM